MVPDNKKADEFSVYFIFILSIRDRSNKKERNKTEGKAKHLPISNLLSLYSCDFLSEYWKKVVFNFQCSVLLNL